MECNKRDLVKFYKHGSDTILLCNNMPSHVFHFLNTWPRSSVYISFSMPTK